MSKMISYKGNVANGEQVKLSLKTLKGKTGYIIRKFQLINEQPGTQTVELIGQIFKKSQAGSISAVIDFDDSELMACATYGNSSGSSYPSSESYIFDNEIVNQDMFFVGHDVGGDGRSVNYYIELEAIALNDLQATQLTLKNLRTIASR